MLLVCSCESTEDPSGDSARDASAPGADAHLKDAAVRIEAGLARDASVDASSQASNWQRVRQSFSILTTLAGRGLDDDGNEWTAKFEGGLATDAELSRPHIALGDAAGNVFIADKEAHAIRKVTPAGIISTVAGTNVAGDAPDVEGPALDGQLSNPNGLWVQPDGTFYIVDLDNAKVRKVQDGVMSTLFTVDGLSVGRGLWVSADESEALVASGSELLRWTRDGGVKTVASGFGSLGMVLSDAEGMIWIGDRGGHGVWTLDAEGEQKRVAGNGLAGVFSDGAVAIETPFDEPRAVWPFDGGFFVGLHDRCQVLYVDDLGVGHLFLDGSGQAHSGDGEAFDTPGEKIGEVRSVSVAPSGDLIVVENDTGFVRVVRSSGQ